MPRNRGFLRFSDEEIQGCQDGHEARLMGREAQLMLFLGSMQANESAHRPFGTSQALSKSYRLDGLRQTSEGHEAPGKHGLNPTHRRAVHGPSAWLKLILTGRHAQLTCWARKKAAPESHWGAGRGWDPSPATLERRHSFPIKLLCKHPWKMRRFMLCMRSPLSHAWRRQLRSRERKARSNLLSSQHDLHVWSGRCQADGRMTTVGPNFKPRSNLLDPRCG